MEKVHRASGPGALTFEDVETALLHAAVRGAEEHKARLGGAGGGGSGGANESVTDPDRLARLFIRSECRSPDGPTLRCYQGRWLLWDGVCYAEVPEDELDADLTKRIKSEFNRDSLETNKDAYKVTRALLSDVRLALTSKVLVRASRGMPSWIGKAPWPVAEVLAARNGLFHLPSLAAGLEHHLPPTSKFLSTFALDYPIETNPTPPVAWLAFLNQLWPNHPDCIATLQEFMGYSLTPDTSQQKILLLVGPPRSGKGSIARVMREMLGPRNVAAATPTSLKAQFGLQELVDKLLVILPDAQIKKHDDAFVERLKTISGEDMVTIDKKYAPPFSTKLPTRLVIMSNELPRFRDPSRALANRFIILPLSESFLGREDPKLGAKLLRELPGILAWSVAGWKRLNERGKFVQPKSGLPLLEELQNLSSQVGHFVKDDCVEKPHARTPKKTLYEAYLKWCVVNGHDYPVAPNTFGVDLRSVVPGLGVCHPSIDGKQVWCYTGVALKV